MRVVIQRVKNAKVEVRGRTIANIDRGLLILVCAMNGDDETTARYLAHKIAKLRIFPDPQGKSNLSLLDVAGEVLVVSQFTLAGEWRKGNRPGFSAAAPPDTAKELYLSFAKHLSDTGLHVKTGEFGAQMTVALQNEGPFTLMLDSESK